MIKPEELRIGNWITTNKGDVTVEELSHLGVIDPDTINHDGFEYFRISPIPLTEEWLERFGFEKVDEEEWVKEDLTISRNVLRDVFVWHPYCDIKSVHQLQNLFYSLTGKEL